MLPVFVVNITSLVAGKLYPAYWTYLALKTDDHAVHRRCMEYWVVFGVLGSAEPFLDFFFFWAPFYYDAKFFFVLWLVLPYANGAGKLYRSRIEPFLAKHETLLTAVLAALAQRAIGLGLTVKDEILAILRQTLTPSLPSEEQAAVNNDIRASPPPDLAGQDAAQPLATPGSWTGTAVLQTIMEKLLSPVSNERAGEVNAISTMANQGADLSLTNQRAQLGSLSGQWPGQNADEHNYYPPANDSSPSPDTTPIHHERSPANLRRSQRILAQHKTR